MTNLRHTQKLAEQLKAAGLMDELQMRSAIARVASFGQRLSRVLLDLGFTDDDTLGAALSRLFKMPVTHLGTVHKDPQAMGKLDARFCEQRGCFPISLKDRVLTLAMVDPTELDVIDEVQNRAGVRVHPVLSTEIEVARAIMRHYLGREPTVASNRARKAVLRDVKSGEVPAVEARPLELDLTAPPAPGTPGAPSFPPELAERLRVAQANQQKTAAILKAVQELLVEKGWRK